MTYPQMFTNSLDVGIFSVCNFSNVLFIGLIHPINPGRSQSVINVAREFYLNVKINSKSIGSVVFALTFAHPFLSEWFLTSSKS